MIKDACYKDGCPAVEYFAQKDGTIIPKVKPHLINTKDRIRDYERMIMHHLPYNDALSEALTANIVNISKEYTVPLDLKMMLVRSWFSDSSNCAHSENYNTIFSCAINMINDSRESIQFIGDIFFVTVLREYLSEDYDSKAYYYIDKNMRDYDKQIRTKIVELGKVSEFCEEFSYMHIINSPSGSMMEIFYEGLPDDCQLGIIV